MKYTMRYNGMKMAMEELNCIHIKTDIQNQEIFFDVPNTISDEQLKRMSHAYKETLNLTLRIKRI